VNISGSILFNSPDQKTAILARSTGQGIAHQGKKGERFSTKVFTSGGLCFSKLERVDVRDIYERAVSRPEGMKQSVTCSPTPQEERCVEPLLFAIVNISNVNRLGTLIEMLLILLEI
jgi:hypothetical protein